ncbi:hypothetical protein [Streptomyces sp. NPDC055749]
MTDELDAANSSVVEQMRQKGDWNPLWDGLAELDPNWTETS